MELSSLTRTVGFIQNDNVVVEVSGPTHWNDLITSHPQGFNFGIDIIYLDFMLKVISKGVYRIFVLRIFVPSITTKFNNNSLMITHKLNYFFV